MTDELSGESYQWGPANYVRLDPATRPAHIFTVTPHSRLGIDATALTGQPRRFRPVTEHHEAIAESFSPRAAADPEWYKRAVFYEVLIRGFQDSTGDGTGDLRGLISRLDYLEWLGIDCIWLLPIYSSPLRDGGYDIADFMAVLPEYGNIGDFVDAGRRGAQARHPGHRRPGHEPHLRSAPVVPGVALRAGRAVRRLLRLVGHRRQVLREPGSSSSTPSSPTGPSTRSAASTTGTGSSPTSRT